jgi:hypothetical protein
MNYVVEMGSGAKICMRKPIDRITENKGTRLLNKHHCWTFSNNVFEIVNL